MEPGNTPPIRRFSLFPKPVSRIIEPVIKPIYKKHGFAEHRILTEWEAIAGKELAAYSVPQKLVRKSLHILAASGRALELQHMQPVILDRIATYFGYRAVEKITFLQTGSAIFRKSPAKKRMKEAAAAGTDTAFPVTCEDEALRKALLALGNALHIRRKNGGED
jgi:hypothetical protein